jgi:uncharacterized membrane protein
VTTGRIEAFSDGVFAIAITLLVLDIRVPKVAEGESLWHALGQQWPSYAAYFVSFATIGIIWVNHHAAFDRIARSSRTLLFVNLLLLLWVSSIPFPTSLVAEYLREGTNEHAAAAVYCATLLAMGATFSAIWIIAARGGLFIQELSERQVRVLLVRNLAGQVAYVIALGLAFVSAAAALALCGLVALYYVLPGRARG